MTGREMLNGVRALLHDTGRGYATESYMFGDEELLVRLNDAKRRVAEMLILQPRPAWLQVSQLIKVAVVAAPYASAPTGFFKLFGGIHIDGAYIPTAPAAVAEPLIAKGHDYVYASGGFIFGPTNPVAQQVLVAVTATETIANTNVPLSEFADSVYFEIMMLAARDTLPGEKSDAIDRWQFFTAKLNANLASFA